MDPRLADLLTRHDLTPDDFYRKGRLPPDKAHVLERRRALVTELHAAGTSWADMVAITGLSQGSIQRLTGAMWNEASRKNVSEPARERAAARKGEEKPWLTEQLKEQWAEGKFDFHRGRVHSDEERAKQRAAYTPAVRARMSLKKITYLQTEAGQNRTYGFKERVTTQKGGSFTTRSSFERRAAERLDADPQVLSFEYEPIFELENGKYIMPDFIVTWIDGTRTLIEVKPKYIFTCYADDHPYHQRLQVAEQEAARRGMKFAIWTEEVLGLDPPHRRKPNP